MLDVVVISILLLATLACAYPAVRMLGEAHSGTLWITTYGFFLIIVLLPMILIYAVGDYDLYNNGEPITVFGSFIEKFLNMEFDLGFDTRLMLGSLFAVLLPQALANLVTGLAGVTPGKIYFGWLVEIIIGLFAKSLVSFSAVEIALLIYSHYYNINPDLPNRNFRELAVVFSSIGIAASGMIFLALCVDAGGYIRVLKRHLRKPIRQWLRFATRNRRRAKNHQKLSLPARRLQFSFAILLRIRSRDVK